ncbi:MAG: transcriptional regulator [Bacteroidia bacterium]|nr:transcriptional regulator [Bacteroidia bacterium]
MKPGDILKVKLQQADGKFKSRPAVAIKQIAPYNDWIVCGISGSIGLEVKGLDIIIDNRHSDFLTWGLPYSGIIRVGFISNISSKYIEGSLGKVSDATHQHIIDNLIGFLKK